MTEEEINAMAGAYCMMMDHPKAPYSLSRMYTENKEDREKIYHAILKFNDNDVDHIRAAVTLFHLNNNKFFLCDLDKSLQALLFAMNDNRLTVKFANNLYLLFHEEPFFTQVKHRNFLSKTFKSDLKSPEWQKTVDAIREIVLTKLDAEIEQLNKKDEKIALLEEAKNMPIFNEHTNNFYITGAFGYTKAVGDIDARLDRIKSPVFCARGL